MLGRHQRRREDHPQISSQGMREIARKAFVQQVNRPQLFKTDLTCPARVPEIDLGLGGRLWFNLSSTAGRPHHGIDFLLSESFFHVSAFDPLGVELLCHISQLLPPDDAARAIPSPVFISSSRRARKRTTAKEWICDTRDSPIPITAPTSFMVSSSK